MRTKTNHTSWKSVTLAITVSLLMSGVASAGPALINISGTVVYCPNPNLPPVPGVTLTLSGDMSGSTTSDSSGNYTFSVPPGGEYTVTPSNADLTPGSAGINSLDVIAVARHILNIQPIPPGCRLMAADVTGDSLVNIKDVVGIERFFLGMATGIGHVGEYQFSPASVHYSSPTSDQTAQNYSALVFGDVASAFVHRPGGPPPDAAGDDMTADEAPTTVAAIALPEVTIDQSGTDFIAAVTTSAIDAHNKLVGFQGDFTFDERVVTFQGEPVQKAGITAGNWNVSGNVLDGQGPIRTLRISAFSNDFTPLSGSGTLFELRMRTVSDSALPSASAQGLSLSNGRIPNSAFPLLWAAPPDHFIFIDTDLNTQKPGNAAPGSITSLGKRK